MLDSKLKEAPRKLDQDDPSRFETHYVYKATIKPITSGKNTQYSAVKGSRYETPEKWLNNEKAGISNIKNQPEDTRSMVTPFRRAIIDNNYDLDKDVEVTLVKKFDDKSGDNYQDAQDLRFKLSSEDPKSFTARKPSTLKNRNLKGKKHSVTPKNQEPQKPREKTPEELAALKAQDKNVNAGSLKLRILDLKSKIEKYSNDRSMKSFIPKLQQQLADAQSDYEKVVAQNEAKQHLQEVARFKKIAGILHS